MVDWNQVALILVVVVVLQGAFLAYFTYLMWKQYQAKKANPEKPKEGK